MEELADSEDSTLKGYRLWYAVDILVEPAPPEKILDISCPCLVGFATTSNWLCLASTSRPILIAS